MLFKECINAQPRAFLSLPDCLISSTTMMHPAKIAAYFLVRSKCQGQTDRCKAWINTKPFLRKCLPCVQPMQHNRTNITPPCLYKKHQVSFIHVCYVQASMCIHGCVVCDSLLTSIAGWVLGIMTSFLLALKSTQHPTFLWERAESLRSFQGACCTKQATVQLTLDKFAAEERNSSLMYFIPGWEQAVSENNGESEQIIFFSSTLIGHLKARL